MEGWGVAPQSTDIRTERSVGVSIFKTVRDVGTEKFQKKRIRLSNQNTRLFVTVATLAESVSIAMNLTVNFMRSKTFRRSSQFMSNANISTKERRMCKVGTFIVILLLAICYAISWIITCGIIKPITICFGLTFSWAIATGFWLILCLLRSVFSITVKK